MSKNKTNSKSLAAYGEGCSRGHELAKQWLENPKRCNPSTGGTLQYVILDLAQRYKEAVSEEEISLIRGEIVGFSYRIECPADSLRCEEAAKRRDYRKNSKSNSDGVAA